MGDVDSKRMNSDQNTEKPTVSGTDTGDVLSGLQTVTLKEDKSHEIMLDTGEKSYETQNDSITRSNPEMSGEIGIVDDQQEDLHSASSKICPVGFVNTKECIKTLENEIKSAETSNEINIANQTVGCGQLMIDGNAGEHLLMSSDDTKLNSHEIVGSDNCSGDENTVMGNQPPITAKKGRKHKSEAVYKKEISSDEPISSPKYVTDNSEVDQPSKSKELGESTSESDKSCREMQDDMIDELACSPTENFENNDFMENLSYLADEMVGTMIREEMTNIFTEKKRWNGEEVCKDHHAPTTEWRLPSDQEEDKVEGGKMKVGLEMVGCVWGVYECSLEEKCSDGEENGGFAPALTIPSEVGSNSEKRVSHTQDEEFQNEIIGSAELSTVPDSLSDYTTENNIVIQTQESLKLSMEEQPSNGSEIDFNTAEEISLVYSGSQVCDEFVATQMDENSHDDKGTSDHGSEIDKCDCGELTSSANDNSKHKVQDQPSLEVPFPDSGNSAHCDRTDALDSDDITTKFTENEAGAFEEQLKDLNKEPQASESDSRNEILSDETEYGSVIADAAEQKSYTDSDIHLKAEGIATRILENIITLLPIDLEMHSLEVKGESCDVYKIGPKCESIIENTSHEEPEKDTSLADRQSHSEGVDTYDDMCFDDSANLVVLGEEDNDNESTIANKIATKDATIHNTLKMISDVSSDSADLEELIKIEGTAPSTTIKEVLVDAGPREKDALNVPYLFGTSTMDDVCEACGNLFVIDTQSNELSISQGKGAKCLECRDVKESSSIEESVLYGKDCTIHSDENNELGRLNKLEIKGEKLLRRKLQMERGSLKWKMKQENEVDMTVNYDGLSSISLLSRASSDDTTGCEPTAKELKEALEELEEKYKQAMVQNAQLDNERAQLNYRVEQLQDWMEEQEDELYRFRAKFKEKCQELDRERRMHHALMKKHADLQEVLRQRDELIQEQGLIVVGGNGVVTGDSGSDDDEVSGGRQCALVTPEAAKVLQSAGDGPLDVQLKHLAEEKQALLDEARRLRMELEDLKRDKELRTNYDASYSENGAAIDMQLLEIQREASKQISEYKFKLQKAEQEIGGCQSNVSRLETQLQRYKAMSESLEKSEDEMRAEKRKLQRDLRASFDRIEEMEMTNSHLEKRLERLRATRAQNNQT